MNKQHYTHDNWSSWLEQLALLFDDDSCGEDLKYEEDFKFLKSSFSNISELDCKKIFIIGTQLTAEKSKDLRIVSYTLLAAAGEYGVEGISYGFMLINSLCVQYFDDLHPIKDKARKGVHVWLLSQQERIIALLEQHNDFTPQALVSFQEQLVIYGSQTARKIDDNAGPLSELSQWVEKLRKKHPVIENVKKEIKEEVKVVKVLESNSTINEPSAIEQNTPVTVIKQVTIESDTQFSDAIRKLLTFDKDKENLARMVALSRAARWSDIKLPPNEQGKTRIPAPRSNAFTPILNALSNTQYSTAFLLGEALFMEGAMHFNLDLQVMQLNALKGLNNNTVLNQLELALYQVVSRFPQLTQLSYDDGHSFCNAKTKDVISDLLAKFNQPTSLSNDENNAFADAEKLAKELVDEGKLDKALSELNNTTTRNNFERSKINLIKAKMCLLSERYDFAEPMLQMILDVIESHDLAQWQPDFCMQVWRNAVLCFDMLAEGNNEQLAEQSKKLKQKMILTQPEVAIGWI